jgi:ATP-dependent DNA ligase
MGDLLEICVSLRLVLASFTCKLGCEGIVSKRLGSKYRGGRSADWIKVKNPAAPAMKREAEEDWSTLGKRLP